MTLTARRARLGSTMPATAAERITRPARGGSAQRDAVLDWRAHLNSRCVNAAEALTQRPGSFMCPSVERSSGFAGAAGASSVTYLAGTSDGSGAACVADAAILSQYMTAAARPDRGDARSDEPALQLHNSRFAQTPVLGCCQRTQRRRRSRRVAHRRILDAGGFVTEATFTRCVPDLGVASRG